MKFFTHNRRFKAKILTAAVLTASVSLNSVAAPPKFQNWGILNTVSDSHIHAVDAWKLEEGNRSVVVAVVDTGVDAEHPDLKQNMWRDPRGSYGMDFVANRSNPKDDNGHGTHVAGIIGATLNAKQGTSGVAHKVSIMAVKYYSANNTGDQNLENSIKALDWAIENGARIINYSGGGPEASPAELAVLKKARDRGVLVVAAAGNERRDSDQPKNLYFPCAYRLENIICVAATNIRKDMLPASNWGKAHVDVAAPGENILSTIPGGRYGYMSGTSQATAFVTGLAALMISKMPSLKPQQIREVLRNTVDRLPSLREKIASEGKVNALAALRTVERMTKGQSVAIASAASIPKKVTSPAGRSTAKKSEARLEDDSLDSAMQKLMPYFYRREVPPNVNDNARKSFIRKTSARK